MGIEYMLANAQTLGSRRSSQTCRKLCIAGARTVIANAAYSFLHPWSHKGNMAVRLKKLHESAQARYDKSKEGLVNAVVQQPPGGPLCKLCFLHNWMLYLSFPAASLARAASERADMLHCKCSHSVLTAVVQTAHKRIRSPYAICESAAWGMLLAFICNANTKALTVPTLQACHNPNPSQLGMMMILLPCLVPLLHSRQHQRCQLQGKVLQQLQLVLLAAVVWCGTRHRPWRCTTMWCHYWTCKAAGRTIQACGRMLQPSLICGEDANPRRQS